MLTKRQIHSVLQYLIIPALLAGFVGLAPSSFAQVPQPSAGNLQRLPAGSVSPSPVPTSSVPLPRLAQAEASVADASLNSIALLSENRLCAVGDRGAIFTSDNAGRSWTKRFCPTTANLQSVVKLGETTLLAAGGWIGKHTNHSSGLLLRSDDYGTSWTPMTGHQLPRLRGLQIQSGRILAWGDYSSLGKASVFESLDGGQSWLAVPLPLGHAQAAAISTTGQLVAIDSLGRSISSRTSPVVQVAKGHTPLNAIAHTAKRWIAIGTRGEVIESLDGRNWRSMLLPLSTSSQIHCQWNSITSLGQDIWIAGSPGSILLHSPDGGATWERQQTNQTQSIRAVQFVDQNRGWLVGSQGLIMATRDGGKSWYPQRNGGKRIGLLAIGSNHAEMPWIGLASTAWDAPKSVSALMVGEIDAIDSVNFLPSRTTTLSDIAPQLGIAQHEIRRTNEFSDKQILTALAVEIMTVQPDVILLGTSRAMPPRNSWNQPALPISAAAQLAGSDSSLEALRDELSLPKWEPQKISIETSGEHSQYTEASQRILREAGVAIWDLLLPLPTLDRDRTKQLSMRTLWAKSQAQSINAGLFDGVAISPAISRDISINEQGGYQLGNYQLVMGRVHRERALSQLSDEAGLTESDSAWIENLNFLIQACPEQDVAPSLIWLIDSLTETLQFERAVGVLELLEKQTADSDAAAWAGIELLRRASSEEFKAWSLNTRPATPQENKAIQLASTNAGINSAGAAAFSQASAATSAVWQASPFDSIDAGEASTSKATSPSAVMITSGSNAPTGEVATASGAVEPARRPRSIVGTSETLWFEQMSLAVKRHPQLFGRPDLELLLARNRRRDGNPNAPSIPSSMPEQSSLIGWPQMAQQESALAADWEATNREKSLRYLHRASYTNDPPFLDGVIDEAFWQSSPPMQLDALESGGSQTSLTKIRWAFDEDYIYIAIDCTKDGNKNVPSVAQQRNYDSPIDHLDHVELLIDVDRDYNTAFEFGIAENGLTFDRYNGMAAFNPKWHVVAKPSSNGWAAEIAIPITSLTTAASLPGSSWAISARRRMDGEYISSWSRLRTHKPLLQGNGILNFPAVK